MEPIERLTTGVYEWSRWREETLDIHLKLDLKNLDLREADFDGYDFRFVDFTGTNLSGAHMRGANLTAAELVDTILVGTDLTDANLSGASMKEACLLNTNLEKADLTSARDYILDATITRQTKFDPYSKDPWSVLRKKYTGPSMLWTLLALASAMTPLLAKTFYWTAFNRFQEFNGLNYSTESHEKFYVVELVLGLNKDSAFWLITLTLVCYNALRGFITYKVAPLRDEEERTGCSPWWSIYWTPKTFGFVAIPRFWVSYQYLYILHKKLEILFYLSATVFIFNLAFWLFQPVWVPISD